MTIIIDGYNVIKPLMRLLKVGDQKRDNFIKQLERYAQISKNQVQVVFDGGDSSFVKTSMNNRVTVIYSGYKSSADEIIKKKISDMLGDTIVVTTDRDICFYAMSLNKVTVDSDAFYAYMMSAIKNNQSLYKEHKKKYDAIHKRAGHDSSPEIDMLMYESASAMPCKYDNDDTVVSIKQKNKNSKLERKIEKIVKKL